MKITSLAPWYCASRTLAPVIAKEIGSPRIFWNEFAGSLAVTLAMPRCPCETANDLHGDIINLARVIQIEGSAVRLFDRVQRTMMHEALFHECAARHRERGNAPAPDGADEGRAYDYLVSSWLGRNGVAGTQSYNQGYCLRFTANGGHSATRFRAVAESIPAWHDRLRHVTILNRNARDTIPRIDDHGTTTLYCDPPYVEKGAKYVHDFAPVSPTGKSGKGTDTGLMSHAELRELLGRFRRARVIVSYYDHPLVRELYKGWTIVPATITKSLVNQSQRTRRSDGEEAPKAPEILCINGPSLTMGSGMFAAEAPCGVKLALAALLLVLAVPGVLVSRAWSRVRPGVRWRPLWMPRRVWGLLASEMVFDGPGGSRWGGSIITRWPRTDGMEWWSDTGANDVHHHRWPWRARRRCRGRRA